MPYLALPLEALLSDDAFSDAPIIHSRDSSMSTYDSLYLDNTTSPCYLAREQPQLPPSNSTGSREDMAYGSKDSMDLAERMGGKPPKLQKKKRQICVYVTNLAKDVTRDELDALFGEVGQLDSIVLFLRRGAPYAHANYRSRESAQKAIDLLNGTSLHSHVMRVEFRSKSKQATSVKSATRAPHTTPEPRSVDILVEPLVNVEYLMDAGRELQPEETTVDPHSLAVTVDPLSMITERITYESTDETSLQRIAVLPNSDTTFIPTPNMFQDIVFAVPSPPASQPQIAFLTNPLGPGCPSPAAITLPSPSSIQTGLYPVLANGLVSPGVGQHVLSDLYFLLDNDHAMASRTDGPNILNFESSIASPTYPHPYFPHPSTALKYPYSVQPLVGSNMTYCSCPRVILDPATGLFRNVVEVEKNGDAILNDDEGSRGRQENATDAPHEWDDSRMALVQGTSGLNKAPAHR
ncbi:hypothetical protein FRB98_001714 [Tulasnella sp. 332]|nr:hypothetical protein FRB98_001714 [Tulasnella sp. 332]